MWKILGRRRGDGKPTYVTMDVTSDDELAVHVPGDEAVILPATKAGQLWVALSEAVQRIMPGRR